MAAVLAQFRFPSPEVSTRAGLYLRTVDAEYSMRSGLVRLGPAGVVECNTYFNAFSVGRWHRHTDLVHLSLAVLMEGECRLEAVHERLGQAPAVVATTHAATSSATWVKVELPPLAHLGEGMVYLRASSLGRPVTIAAARWQTDDLASCAARLGVVITTFNRGDEIRANIDLLLRALNENPAYAERVEVLIVDNASNLELPVDDNGPVVVVSSTNTGGAGGFSRGLLHFRSRPGVTHVLFMDDDVRFDPEIILRTIQVLSFASDARLCVAGAMLTETTTTEQFEAGARYAARAVYPTRAIGQGLDLLDWDVLLQAEQQKERIDYGAWWYFAFPVGLTRENPIPAFLRGDDVCWGLMHAGVHTVTFNGIGLWHEDFTRKNGPSTWFYDTRNFALVGVLAVPRCRARHLLWRYVNICGRSLLCFKYDSASRITFGMREFLLGPQHWLDLDPVRLNDQVSAYDGERVAPLGPELAGVSDLRARSKLLRVLASLWSIIVLGGHLLPSGLRRRPLVAVPVQHRAVYAASRRDAILYRSPDHKEGFVARRDQSRFFSLLVDMVVTAGRILIRFRSLKADYRAAYPEMVSDEYWARQFAGPDPPDDATSQGRQPGAVGR